MKAKWWKAHSGRIYHAIVGEVRLDTSCENATALCGFKPRSVFGWYFSIEVPRAGWKCKKCAEWLKAPL